MLQEKKLQRLKASWRREIWGQGEMMVQTERKRECQKPWAFVEQVWTWQD